MTTWIAPEKAPPVVTWAAGLSTIKDDVQTYGLTLNITPAFSTPRRVIIGALGTGRHGFDWRFDQLSNPYDQGGILVNQGVTSLPIVIQVNENLDLSETYIPTIRAVAGVYSVGANPAHIVTCNRGATKPDAAAVASGFIGCGNHSALTAWGGGDIDASRSGTTISYKYFDGQVKIFANNVTFDHCWFKGHGGDYAIYLRAGWSGATFSHCEFGSDGGPGHYNHGAMIYAEGYHDDTYRGVRCEFSWFHDWGHDAVKAAGRGWQFDTCFFERPGCWNKYPNDLPAQYPPHADTMQKQDGWEVYDVDFYRCNLLMPLEITVPLGYASNSNIMLNDGVAQNIRVRSSWCSGGNVTFLSDDDDGDPILTGFIRNCRVDTRLYDAGTGIGAFKYNLTSGSSYKISGCVADDSGSKDPVDVTGAAFNNTRAF